MVGDLLLVTVARRYYCLFIIIIFITIIIIVVIVAIAVNTTKNGKVETQIFQGRPVVVVCLGFPFVTQTHHPSPCRSMYCDYIYIIALLLF